MARNKRPNDYLPFVSEFMLDSNKRERESKLSDKRIDILEDIRRSPNSLWLKIKFVTVLFVSEVNKKL